MGVLSFLGAARRKVDAAPAPAAPAYTPKPTVDAALERIEARFGGRVRPAGVRIREAFLWHRTGRKADAFAAFHGMLADPQLVADSPAARVALEAEIHARLRLCYEREGCFTQALVETALTYAVRAKAVAAEGNAAALQQLRDVEFVQRYFRPVLERARLPHAHVRFRAILDEHLKTLPMVDTAALKEALERFCQNPPPPPKRVVERVAGRLHITELHGA
jgi:hypothetical protein